MLKQVAESICQASDGVWNPVRCHYGLHRMDIEIRNQPRVCSLDAMNDLGYLNGHLGHLSGHSWHLNGQPLEPEWESLAATRGLRHARVNLGAVLFSEQFVQRTTC